jgi:hypothetical protein
VDGRVFPFVLSVSSSALNRVGFQFLLPASSFLVRLRRPVPTRLFSCCCFLIRSVAAAGLALVSARASVRISIPTSNSPAGLFGRSSVLALVSSSSFLIPVPCSNTRLANILFLGLRGLVLLAEHITGDSVFLWFRACPVSKKCNFSVCLFSLLSSNPSLLLALLASAVTRVSCRQIIVCWFLLCDSSVDLTPSDFFSPLVFSCSR